MFFKLTSAFAVIACANSSAEETWMKADARMDAMRKSFAEIRDHAHKVVEDEQRAMAKAEADAAQSESELKKSESALVMNEEDLAKTEAKLSVPVKVEESSSFMEISDVLSKYPKVAEDMKQVREAERVYKEKMQALHDKDAELMSLAKKDFEDSKNAVHMMGNLRTQRKHRGASSFVQMEELPPAFARVLKAEAELKKVNDDLAKEFNFA